MSTDEAAFRRLFYWLAGIIVGLLGVILWVMWERIDTRRDTDHTQNERLSRVEGQVSAVLESIQHDGEQ